MPVSAGSAFSRATQASMPPADAPIATTGKASASGGGAASSEAGDGGFRLDMDGYLAASGATFLAGNVIRYTKAPRRYAGDLVEDTGEVSLVVISDLAREASPRNHGQAACEEKLRALDAPQRDESMGRNAHRPAEH